MPKYSSELEAFDSETSLFLDNIYRLSSERECLLDYFSGSPAVMVEEWNAVSDRLDAFEWHMRQTLTGLLEESSVSARIADYNKWKVDFEAFTENTPCCVVNTFASSMTGKRLSGFQHSIENTVHTPTYRFAEDLAIIFARLDGGLLCENEAMAKNLLNLLAGDGIAAAICGFDDCRPELPSIVYGAGFPGFELTVPKFTVMAACASCAGQGSVQSAVRRKKALPKRSAKEKILSYADLNVGDYVVHANHGIGQYLGLENLVIEGARKDFVKIATRQR